MKNHITFLLFAVFLLSTLFISCEKEGSNETGNLLDTTVVAGIFKAKLNGHQWVANKYAYAIRDSGFIYVRGINLAGNSINLLLNDNGVGRYSLSSSTTAVANLIDSAGKMYTSFGSTDTAQAGGVVVITSIDTSNKTMNGTFSFNLLSVSDSSVIRVTEGSFTNMHYAPANGVPVICLLYTSPSPRD